MQVPVSKMPGFGVCHGICTQSERGIVALGKVFAMPHNAQEVNRPNYGYCWSAVYGPCITLCFLACIFHVVRLCWINERSLSEKGLLFLELLPGECLHRICDLVWNALQGGSVPTEVVDLTDYPDDDIPSLGQQFPDREAAAMLRQLGNTGAAPRIPTFDIVESPVAAPKPDAKCPICLETIKDLACGPCGCAPCLAKGLN
jgi:hypothetical protein